MSTLASRPLLSTFLPSINALLTALGLPFTIEHPTDLTPSLLLAIFESLINARLPIPASVRQSRTQDAKARAMLVLLGVLECDVLRGGTSTDAEHSIAASNADDSVLGGAGGVSVDGWVDEIGLGEVDPERLADGGWEETIFVGELLCWLARRKGILPRAKSSHRSLRSLYSNHHSYGTEGDTADFSTSLLLRPSSAEKPRSPRPPSPSQSIGDIEATTDPDYSALSHITDVPRHPLVHSPEPSLSLSATTGTDLSIRARSVSSRTSVSNMHDDPDEFEEASHDTIQLRDHRQMILDAEEDDDRPPTFRPQCIHELDDPSYICALAGPSSSFDPSVSHERIPEDEDDPSRDDDDADSQDNDDPYAPPTPTPQRIRLTGWIDTVDTTTELSHFAASRSRSRGFNTSGGSGLGPPRPHKLARTGVPAKIPPRPQTHVSSLARPSSSKLRSPRRIPPSPSSSPPPPSPSPLTSSKHASRHTQPSPPPEVSDPPFDVSFSTLNNTSTPAKSRPPRRPQFQTTTRHEIVRAPVDRDKSSGSAPRPRRRERSPSYTPSPPSFTTPGSLRGGVAGGASSTRAGSFGVSDLKMRVGTSGTPAPAFSAAPFATVPMRKNNLGGTPPLSMNVKGKSPPPAVPAGSTATTNTLLTERARLLTELAALKRARAASNAGQGMVMGTASGGEVGRRLGVGVGVRS